MPTVQYVHFIAAASDEAAEQTIFEGREMHEISEESRVSLTVPLSAVADFGRTASHNDALLPKVAALIFL